MSSLPLTALDASTDEGASSRFAVVTGLFSKLKQNAASTFSDVSARAPPRRPRAARARPPPPGILTARPPLRNLLTPQAKPLAEVFDVSALSRPAHAGEVAARLRKNGAYFRTNYAALAVGTTALVMLMNPWSLLVLAALGAGWFYAYIVRAAPLVIGGRELSDREKFGALAGGSLFVVFFLTSVGATIFYALGLSALMVGAHAALRAPDDSVLFSDEVPQEAGGLAGILDMFRPRGAAIAAAAGV